MLQKPLRLLTLLALAGGTAAYGQSCHLIGTLHDAETHLALPYAALTVGGNGTLSDDEGHFLLNGLPCEGALRVRVSLLGYDTLSVEVRLPLAKPLNLHLSPKANALSEIEVQGVRAARGAVSGQSVATLSGRQLEALRGLPLADQLAAVPGVNALRSGPTLAKPVIHGLYGNRVLILNNGVRLEGQQWGSDHAPEIDPYLGGQIRVVRGAASLLYGSDAIGGVVLVEPDPLPSSRRLGGHLNLGANSNGRGGAASGLVEGGTSGGIGYRIQLSGRRSGYLRAPGYYIDNTSLYEANGSAALGLTRRRYGASLYVSSYNTRVGLFSGASVGTVADLDQAIARAQPVYQPGFSYALGRPYQLVGHQLGKAQAYYSFSKNTRARLQYAVQQDRRQEYDFVSITGHDQPELSLDLTTHHLRAEVDHRLAPCIAGTAGAEAQTQANVWQNQFLIPNYRNYAGGAFLTERYTAGNLAVEGGARLDYKWLRSYFLNPNTLATYGLTRSFFRPSFSLGADYAGPGPVRLSGNLSSAWRAPSANELYSNGVHQSAVSYERGTAGLVSELAYNASLTAALKTRRLTAEATGYANRIDHYIYLKPDLKPVRTVRGAFPAFTYTQTDAVLTGFDASAQLALAKGLSLRHKSSFLWAHDRSTGGYLVYIPANRFEHALRYEPMPAMAPCQAYIQISLHQVLRQYRAPANGDYAPPPPAYALAGLEAGIATKRLTGRDLSLVVTVTNALDARYRDYLDRFRYFTDQPGRNVALRLSADI